MVKRRPHILISHSHRKGSRSAVGHRQPTAIARRGPQPSSSGGRSLQQLTALLRDLFATWDESEILRLAMDHVATAGPYIAEAGYLLDAGGDLVPSAGNRQDHALMVQPRVRDLAGQDGSVAVPGRHGGQALGLRGLDGLHGYLVVTSRSPPTGTERFLLATLVRHTAAALSVAFAQRRRREEAGELHDLREERAALQRQLVTVVGELAYRESVHGLTAAVAASGGDDVAVTRALYALTGLPALVEDRFGRLRSWAGPQRPDPYPEPDPVRQTALLNKAAREAGPTRIEGRLIALVRAHGEILGMLALVDPLGEADEHAVLALEQAVMSLAPELAHLRNQAEVELRLHRELADDLLAGTDETSAYARSEAVGHDLRRSHYIVVVRWSDRDADDSFAQVVGRAASAVGMRSLLTRGVEHVVLLADERPHAGALYEAIAQDTGAPSGSIGVSARCDSPDDFPQHYQEAQRALEVLRHSRKQYGMTFFDQLGLYRILGPGNNLRELEAFVHEWLGKLIDYDAGNNSAMTETLARYFDCGGNYDETAASLSIHRSTLRYRLQRIREISGNDLANVQDRLNLQVATRVWKIVLGGSG
ncbi:PucR family transcriptional regulator [Streptomyces sp. NPDC059611]|uniref:PucR family transcriptional regulator n=1 Tax=Streptomyces sp. NPDC059611 TaxID=3346884 RepID=UPI00367E5DD3